MSKKKLYLIIGITAIVTIGFFLAAYIISQENGAPRESEKNTFLNFFPFGKSSREGGDSANSTINGSGSGDFSEKINESSQEKRELPRLRQISKTPTAGMYPIVRSGKTIIRYVERATGNIYETNMGDMHKTRISNSLIPRVQEAFFVNEGKSVLYRYVAESGSFITTFITSVPTAASVKTETQIGTSTDTVSGSFLEENILHAIPSFDTKSLFYTTKSSDFQAGGGKGNIFNFSKNTASQVFSSPFSEWLPVYFDGKTVALQTKASQNIPGFLYSITLPNGELQKIIGDINGLTALPDRNLQKILYSESTRGGLKLRIYDRKEKSSIDVTTPTLPEKCVWTIDGAVLYCAIPDYLPAAEYPDTWYQGSVALNDAVWKIDPSSGNTSILFITGTFNAPEMDMTSLTLTPNAEFLFFINKNDSTLWGYQLVNPEI